MRLFICHASEDKKDFVKPLVAALDGFFEVWFDERDLTLGDSLLDRISAGLNSSDFGVVVLSPSFFAKKWPKAELDGLFALESSTRKVILPIWKDVTEGDVKRFSPILAGRLAVHASEGIEKVVEAIRLAVDTSARQRELTGLESASQRLKGLDETLTERNESTRLLNTEEGATLVAAAADALFGTVETTLSEMVAGALKFTFTRHNRLTFLVDGPFGLTLHLSIRSLANNSATTARLSEVVLRQTGYVDEKLEILKQQEFSPSFRRTKQVGWKASSGNQTLSTEELAGHALDLFRVEIERLAPKQ